jgi:soluble lytic murein transglycosylase-like protein
VRAVAVALALAGALLLPARVAGAHQHDRQDGETWEQAIDLGQGYARKARLGYDAQDRAVILEWLGDTFEIDARPATPPATLQRVAGGAGGDVEAMTRAAARRWRVDENRMVRTMRCESRGDPRATARAGYRGLFQFDAQTWAGRAPLVGVSPDFGMAYDAAANIEVAASTMAAGQWSRWPVCAF